MNYLSISPARESSESDGARYRYVEVDGDLCRHEVDHVRYASGDATDTDEEADPE